MKEKQTGKDMSEKQGNDTKQGRQVTGFRVSWEADHEQYWQGHGIAMSEYDECATGTGETLREALEDALGSLAQSGIDVDSIMRPPCETPLTDLMLQVREPGMIDWDIVQSYCDAEGKHTDTCPVCDGQVSWQRPCENCEQGQVEIEVDKADCAVCAGEWHFYVSVDVKVDE